MPRALSGTKVLRVAFVYPPIGHEPFEENLKVVDEEFGRLPPLSLAYAAAIAEQAGHDVRIVDANALELDLARTIETLRPFVPQVLAFTSSTYMFRRVALWASELRRAFGVPTILGGVNLGLYPTESIEAGAFDHGVLHYATEGFPALLDALERGTDPAGLPEVITRRDGKVVQGPVHTMSNPYLRLPLPARHLLPNERYHSILSRRQNFTIQVTGTGCPAPCTFCAIPRVRRYRNPVERAVSEVVRCHDVHGVREIDFFDADFFCDHEWLKAFCSALIDRRMDIEWSCRASLANVDDETVSLAHRAGCRAMFVGIETGNVEALKAMRKRLDPATARRSLEIIRDNGVRALGFFMLGVPGETHASAARTILYSMSLPIDFAQYSRLIAKPGSRLHKEMIRLTGTDFWRDWVLGRAVPRRLPNLWSRIDDDAIETWAKLAYLAFYYRPNQILRTLARIRDRDEFLRGLKAAGRMVGNMLHSDLDPE